MNRQARRSAAQSTPPVALLLVGGPLGGAIVPGNAPALRPDWYRTWPAIRPRSLGAAILRQPAHIWPPVDQRAPGRYVPDDDTVTPSATWQLYELGQG
jgi:hypothetical protein